MAQKGGPRKTILVVEDDPFSREVMVELLTEEHYAVVEAKSGEEALLLVGRAYPDVVVLDLALPRMSGLDVLRELRANAATAQLPVIVVSAYSSLMREQDAARADALIQKPFLVEHVLSAVDSALSVQRSLQVALVS